MEIRQEREGERMGTKVTNRKTLTENLLHVGAYISRESNLRIINIHCIFQNIRKKKYEN